MASPTQSVTLKSACKHCGGRIGFPPAAAGTSINCPHCGKETLLLPSGLPPGAAARPAAAAPAAVPTAKPAVPVAVASTPPAAPAAETDAKSGGEDKAAARKNFVICGTCGTEISVKAKACPACGAPVKSSRRGLLVVMIVALVLVAGAVGAVLFLKKGGKLMGPKQDLEVVKFELQRMKDTSLVYVVGTIKNSSEQQHQSVRVDFNLFDKKGKQIGAASDYIMILEPKAQWDFKALVVEAEAATAKLDKIVSVKQ